MRGGHGSQQCHSALYVTFVVTDAARQLALTARPDLPRSLRCDRRRAALTYAELEREATAAARRLAARGARRGATVALMLPAGLEYVVLLHALMKLGAVAYPVNTRLSEAEVSAELDRDGRRR